VCGFLENTDLRQFFQDLGENTCLLLEKQCTRPLIFKAVKHDSRCSILAKSDSISPHNILRPIRSQFAPQIKENNSLLNYFS